MVGGIGVVGREVGLHARVPGWEGDGRWDWCSG